MCLIHEAIDYSGFVETDSSNSPETEMIDLRGDGRIVLFQRSGLRRRNWYARVRVPNATGYKILSSKTSDLDEAKRFANDLYEQTYMQVLSGGSIHSPTFKKVFEEWEASLDQLGSNRQGGSWNGSIDRVRTYALEFFGSMKVDQIRTKDFENFWSWRRTNYVKKTPSNSTLGREKNAIMPLFRFAMSKGCIASMPEIRLPKTRHRRRPTFTLTEYNTLTRKMRSWVKEAKGKAHWRDRYVFQQVFLILSNSGLRVGELRRLTWGDLRTVGDGDDERMVGYANGKTGAREFVFMPSGPTYVERLRELRKVEIGEELPSDGLVVCHRDGKPIATFKRSFNNLLSYAGVGIKREGMARTIYSLRHFYATQRLTHETNPFLLAKQMGTSVEMLEKYYGQTVTSEVAKQITKGGLKIK